jgi:hypothetical protein
VDVNAPVQLPLPVELIAIGIGAMYGTLSAVKERLAISGVVALAVVLGLGGGLIRDTLIQRGTPVAFTTPSYLLTAVTVGVIAVLLAGSLVRMRFLLDGLDALSFALFAVLGADKALLAGIPVLGAMLIGELTGTVRAAAARQGGRAAPLPGRSGGWRPAVDVLRHRDRGHHDHPARRRLPGLGGRPRGHHHRAVRPDHAPIRCGSPRSPDAPAPPHVARPAGRRHGP